MASAHRTIRSVACALTVLAIAAAPAAAHPFGPPPTARVHADGHVVTIAWKAAPDDALAIGEHLGVLPPGTVDGMREAMTQVAPAAADEAALDASPALRGYLLRRIRVIQDGRACDATVRRISDFVGQGAVTVHRCPRTVAEVELDIRMLHDIHEAYRTFVVSTERGPRPGQSVHTTTSPRRTWDFTATDGGRRSTTGPALGPWEPRFLRLIDLPAPTPWIVLGALLLAAGIGALHALAPGHGKALGATYLAGGRARPRDAVLLGAAVAGMHTASVLALGLGLHALAVGGRALEQTGPWLAMASGLLVLAVGVGSLIRVARRRSVGPAQAPTHAHARAAEHSHARPPTPTPTHDRHDPQLPRDIAPLSRRGLVLIGLSGGLMPSPSAFLVLTTAMFTGRTLFGLALVAAFSVGLATTLALLGLAVLRGRTLVDRAARDRPRLTAALLALPLVSATLITLAGAWLTTAAVRALL